MNGDSFINSTSLLPPPSVEATVMFEPVVVKTTAVEISPVVPFEERTVVFEVETIAVVAVPGRIIIICISGEISFTDRRCGIVSACIYRSGGICAGVYDRRSDIDPGYRYPHANAGGDKYLGITFSSDEAGGYNCGKNK